MDTSLAPTKDRQEKTNISLMLFPKCNVRNRWWIRLSKYICNTVNVVKDGDLVVAAHPEL